MDTFLVPYAGRLASRAGVTGSENHSIPSTMAIPRCRHGPPCVRHGLSVPITIANRRTRQAVRG